METISLLVKTRNGVAVNQAQLFNIDDIVGPINPSAGGADSIFVYREGKKGPFSNAPGGSALTTFVVDQTLAEIEVLGIAIFTANVVSQSGRTVPNTPMRAFNANYVCGPVKPFNGGSKYSYQEDTNSDLVEYVVTQTPAQILVQIQFTGGGGSGTGDITGNLTANHLVMATSAKNIADTYCTYTADTLTLRGQDNNNILTVGNGGVTLSSSVLSVTSSTTISLNATGKINIVANGVAASQLLSTDGSGNLTSVNVSTTQILYINSFTSNPQTQIDTKISGNLTAGLMPFASAAKVLSNTQLFFDGTSKWGFMTVTPTHTVHINGTFKLVDGTQGVGKILSCDSTGFASWIPAPAAGLTNPLTTTGDIIQGNPNSTPDRLAAVATGNVLISGGVAALNSWGKVGLTTHVTGVLPPINGGSGTATVMTPGSVLFAGASGVFTQDNTSFFYDLANNALRLGGATYNTAVLNVKSPLGKSGVHIDISASTGGFSAIIVTHANTSTGYVTSSTGSTAGLFINTSTVANSNSMVRFRNGSIDSAVLGTLYVDGSSANFVIGVSKVTGDATHSAIYIKGSTISVGIGYDFKTPTATLHVIGATTAQSSFSITPATALPTTTSRFAGDINFIGTRYYGYKANNTVEEAFAYLSDITGFFVKLDGTTPLTGDWNAGSHTITTRGVVIGGASTGITVTGSTIGMTIDAVGDGIRVNSDSIAITANGESAASQFVSPNYAGKFYQSGDLAVNSTSHTVSITRDIVLNGNTNIGSMLYINNVTASTGDFLTLASNGTIKVAFKSTGVFQYIDGNQAAGKVLISDINGNASWGVAASGFTNPMTNIGDIIQANTGGTPQRLGNATPGSSAITSGSFLINNPSGLNEWSRLQIPNTLLIDQIPYAGSANTLVGTSELRYVSGASLGSQLLVTKNVNGTNSFRLDNPNAGNAVFSQIRITTNNNELAIGLSGPGVGSPNRVYLTASGAISELAITNASATAPTKFFQGSTEIMRLNIGGLAMNSSGVSANVDPVCILELTSNTRGFRLPRQSTAERTGMVTTGKAGIFVYDIDLDKPFYTNTAGTWVAIN